mmetsp:Transcript_133984/g.244374  ORF Transcript_133984/g.244374 Transcript_133984/m.244374 type:complete len:184 (-) Transcript_133984:229-780(-)
MASTLTSESNMVWEGDAVCVPARMQNLQRACAADVSDDDMPWQDSNFIADLISADMSCEEDFFDDENDEDMFTSMKFTPAGWREMCFPSVLMAPVSGDDETTESLSPESSTDPASWCRVHLQGAQAYSEDVNDEETELDSRPVESTDPATWRSMHFFPENSIDPATWRRMHSTQSSSPYTCSI